MNIVTLSVSYNNWCHLNIRLVTRTSEIYQWGKKKKKKASRVHVKVRGFCT